MTKHTSREAIINALEITAGDITAAAELLGIRRETIYYRIAKDQGIKQIIEDMRAVKAVINSADHYEREPATQEREPAIFEREPASLEREPAADRETTADTLPTDEAPTETGTAAEAEALHEPPAEPLPHIAPLPTIAQRMKQQAARDLAASIRAFIEADGLPIHYAPIFDYLKYLDDKAAGSA